MKRLISTALCAAFLLLSVPRPALAEDPIKAVEGSLSGLLVGGIIDKIQNAANQLMANATNDGNMLEFQAGDQANMVLGNANFLLNTQRDKTFGELSTDEQTALATMYYDTQQLLTTTFNNVWLIQNVSVVDLRQLENNLPLATQSQMLMQAVAGTVLLGGAPTYKFAIVGDRMGLTGDNDKTTYALKLNGSVIPITASSVRANLEGISVDASVFAPYFQDGKIVYEPAEIDVVNDHLYPAHFLNHGGWGKSELHIPLRLALVSQNAGTFTLTYREPHYQWVDNGFDFPTGFLAYTDNRDGHPENPSYESETYRLGGGGADNPTANDKIFTSWQLSACDGPHDPGVCNFRVRTGCTIGDNSTTLTCGYGGVSWPLRMSFNGRTSSWRNIGADDVKTMTVNPYYGTTLSVTLPADTTFIEIKGAPSFGAAVDVVYPNADPGGLLGAPTVTVPTTTRVYSWQVTRPDASFNPMTAINV